MNEKNNDFVFNGEYDHNKEMIYDKTAIFNGELDDKYEKDDKDMYYGK